VGKFFEVALEGLTKEEAEKQIDAASETILSNPTIETYQFEIVED
jgi:phosphoribosylformylglycinamidine (FGAM) synthase PurS component